MGLEEQSIVGCFPEFVFQFLMAQVLVGLFLVAQVLVGAGACWRRCLLGCENNLQTILCLPLGCVLLVLIIIIIIIIVKKNSAGNQPVVDSSLEAVEFFFYIFYLIKETEQKKHILSKPGL